MNFFKILTNLGMEIIPATVSDIRKAPKNKDFTGIVKGGIIANPEDVASIDYGPIEKGSDGFYKLKETKTKVSKARFLEVGGLSNPYAFRKQFKGHAHFSYFIKQPNAENYALEYGLLS